MVLSLTVVNYKGASKRTEIIIWADKLVSDIRLMENNALAVRTFNDDSTRNVWGVYFDTSAPTNGHYVLYNDANSNNSFNAGETYRDIILPDHIIIESVAGYIGATATSISQTSIIFVPPDPQVKFLNNTTEPGYDKLIITLRDTINGSIKTITVNFFGVVEVSS